MFLSLSVTNPVLTRRFQKDPLEECQTCTSDTYVRCNKLHSVTEQNSTLVFQQSQMQSIQLVH